MVLILNGNLKIGEHVRSDLGYQIWYRRFLRLREVTNLIFFSQKNLFSCTPTKRVLSYRLIYVLCGVQAYRFPFIISRNCIDFVISGREIYRY